MRNVPMKYNYPNPCDTCDRAENCNGCDAWRTRVRTIWKQFNNYNIRQYKKQEKSKNFVYEHPDMIKKYLDEGPCKGCEFELLCDVPCNAYWRWWDARMAILKKKYGME